MKLESEKTCYSRGPEPGSVLRWVVDQSAKKLRKRGIATQLRGPTETQPFGTVLITDDKYPMQNWSQASRAVDK